VLVSPVGQYSLHIKELVWWKQLATELVEYTWALKTLIFWIILIKLQESFRTCILAYPDKLSTHSAPEMLWNPTFPLDY
jgi:hypothetical protein